ncbi:MAG: hypothetical protein WCV88_02185 [Patescibacteria group bacterium]|jgi:hypothetical protein
MKTKPIVYIVCVNLIVILLVSLSLWVIYLALLGDTTLLGDPYYEDQILAPTRAFGPWSFMLLVMILAIIAKITEPAKS